MRASKTVIGLPARRHGLRTCTVLALVSAVFASTVTLAAAATTPETGVTSPSPPTAEKMAAQRAHDSGQPVEVADETTETRRIVANPDGTFTLTSSVQPVRVKRDGTWIPVDTTLKHGDDGRIRPTATPGDIAFSGGGAAPLVTLTKGNESFSLSWPKPLPAPTLSGASAVYPAVFPGVDLQVTAQADSYSEVLIVHDAVAAANPALTEVSLVATGKGLSVAADVHGLSAKDSTGHEVFHGATPRMWDSTQDGRGGTPTATDPGSGRITPLTISSGAPQQPTANSTTVTLTPSAPALTGPDVTYPVYIDPSMSGGLQTWLVVSNGSTSEHIFSDPTFPQQVGYCGDYHACNNIGTARSYFQMDSSAIMKRNGKTATIFSAYFYANEIHQFNGCTDEPVDLYEAGYINSSTTWPGPLYGYVDRQSSHAGDQCGGAGNVVFNAIAAARDAAAGNWSTTTFGLIAPNEGDGNQWKKFAPTGTYDITFSFPPNDAGDLHVSHEVLCGGKTYTPDASPTLYATATDNNNPPLGLGLWFQLWDSTGSSYKAGNGTAANSASGARAGWQPTVNLGNSDNAFKVTVENGFPGDSTKNLWSPGWSPWLAFTAISTPITQTPTLSSYDYPAGDWGVPQGTGGKISVNATGIPYVAGFAYTFAGAGTETVPHTTDCAYDQAFANGGWISTADGTASITVPGGLSPGYHTMHVRAFDKAHNLSPESAPYTFYIAPNLGVTTTHLEAENSTQVAAAQPAGQNAGLAAQADPGWPWSGHQQLWFDGGAAGQSFTAAFTAPIEADYALGANFSQAPDYGKLLITLDGKPVANTDVTPWDGYRSSGASTYVPFGGRHLSAGSHTYKVTLVDSNPSATGKRYGAGLDYLSVIPLNQATASSFTDAMNNHGVSIDNSTIGSLDFGTVGMSAQSLAAAGLAPGAVFTYSGARFTMPAANPTTGNDNVVAAGQTIPLPADQQVKATAIGLLAFTTCGVSPATSMSVTYTDGTHSDPYLAQVPDWIDGSPTQAPAAVLSHWNMGTAPGTFHPKLYAVFVPTDPGKRVAAVSLPNIGTTFLPETCARALHVMAMAPRPVDAGWIGAWSAPADAATQPPGVAGLADQTLRLLAHPSISGTAARIRLSNTGVDSPTTIDDTTLAAQNGTGAATAGVPVQLSFCGNAGLGASCGRHSVTLPAGGEAYSDPVPVPAAPTGNLVISLHLPTAVTRVPAHRSANNGSYLASGDVAASTEATPFTTGLASSYYLAAIDFSTTDPAQGTVAVLGDQTTAAGSPGGTYQPTWVDKLPAKLAAGGTPLPGGLINTSLAGVGPIGQWRLDEGAGTTAIDSGGNHDATLGTGVGWSSEHGGSAMFSGTSGAISTPTPVLNTARDYSVSAWVKLSSTSTSSTAVSQGGKSVAGFSLQYSTAFNAWTFAVQKSDSADSAQAVVHASTPPALNTWTHLVGVFDVTSGNMTLYVNGAPAGTVRDWDIPWNASGPLAIGGIKLSGGGSGGGFTGSIAETKVFQKALAPEDVTMLVNGGPPLGPQPRSGALSTGNAVGTLDQTVRSAPNLRSVVVALGTNDILAGTTVTTIEQELTALLGFTGPGGLKNTQRADGTGSVRVILTTVPPLGLAPGDRREANREQLNNDILQFFKNYGADDVVDFDKAVRDSGNVAGIAPGYLSGTTQNDAYYDKVAQTLADAVNTFPPGAQL